jgi:hypothetical protein
LMHDEVLWALGRTMLRTFALFRRRPPPRGHAHYLGLRNFRMNWSVCP